MFGRYFGQLVTWLKINYFGESNQLLGPLCLWQCFFVIPYFQYFAPPRHFPQFLLSVPILHLKQTKCKMGSISKYLTPLIHFEMSTLVVVELKLWVGTLSCQDQRATFLTAYSRFTFHRMWVVSELRDWLSFGRAFLGMLSLFEGLNNFSPPKKIIT